MIHLKCIQYMAHYLQYYLKYHVNVLIKQEKKYKLSLINCFLSLFLFDVRSEVYLHI